MCGTCSTKTETPWHVLTGRREHEEEEDPFGNFDHVFVVEHVFLCAFGPFWDRVGTPKCSRGVKVGLGGASYDQMCFFIDF